ncbi:MAG: carboxylating nicotinate-nucleotide diphosphorylase [Bacteroidota bacterium]
MLPDYLSEATFNDFIERAFSEDIGDGDHTTLASVPNSATRKARLIVKDTGVLAGMEAARRIFQFIDKNLTFEPFLKDGDEVKYGDIGFHVNGCARSILTAERIVLNTMQRMSGIATQAQKAAKLLEGTKTRVLDTRKTTPNFRAFEKWAVATGGGTNHRFGLFDLIMLKDNHIDFAGGVENAITAVQEYLKTNQKSLRIEVETRNLEEVEEVLRVGGVDIIMLDNLSLEDMKTAVKLIGGRCEIEASGGITLQTLRQVADCGVDFVSMGALIHSAGQLDMSLKAV